jgi:S1-C subfamily serine protease
VRSTIHAEPVFQRAFVQVAERLSLSLTDWPEFRRVVEAGLHFTSARNVDEKLRLLDAGCFSEELLQALISGGESFLTGPVAYIWERLRDRQIVAAAFGASAGAMSGVFVDHVMNRGRLAQFLLSDTFLNIFAPPSELLARYRHAIVSIDVTTPRGQSRGSGLIVDTGTQPMLVTCRHNVDPADGIDVDLIKTSAGAQIIVTDFRLHPTTDIATMGVRSPVTGPLLRLSPDVAVFDEVYTLGYPAVPGVLDPGVVAHRGEVNGRVTTYTGGGQDLLLISNLISPGNSGGPLLDRDGFCVGMSTQWLEGEYGNERARFSAAIPADVIATWLDTSQRSL